MNWKMFFSLNVWVFLVNSFILIHSVFYKHEQFGPEMFFNGIFVIVFSVLSCKEIICDKLNEIEELIKSQKKEN